MLTALFALSCLLLAPVIDLGFEANPAYFHRDLNKLPLEVFHYLFNPSTLLWGSIGIFAFLVRRKIQKGPKLSRRDAEIANWFLINAIFFNSVMDGFAGQLQAWPGMTERYNALDPRYPHCGGIDLIFKGCHHHASVPVYLTSLQEILFQVPLGLAAYFAYYTHSSYRLPLQLVHSCCALFGVWYFYPAEMVSGYQMVLHNHETWTVAQKVFNFYLGFCIIPLAWVFVPLWLIVSATNEIAAQSSPKQAQTKKHK